ncbi:D-glycero-alpha-D-manno-heptose-7-phosphate kinase [uncultured Gammaproteobacteria bacterium]
MIISRTPYRVSLFGGGTDYPKWYLNHGGAVIGGAIDKYCTISVRTLPPFFEHKHRIVYSLIELVQTIDQIRHPAVRAVLGELKLPQGLEIHHDGDLPARSGLGTSSSFTVGLLHALYALSGRMASKRELAEEAIRIEQEVIRENVGSQDQIWAAFGGMNRIEFTTESNFDVAPLIIGRERRAALEDSLLLVFTGLSRFASDVARGKIENLDRREPQLHALRAMVDEAMAILCTPSRPLAEIGDLLHQGWQLKRELADGVTNPEIDALYQAALDGGALGGKLLGAGGGGFLLLFVPPERQPRLRERLKDQIIVAFRFDDGGSKIVVYEPDDFRRRRRA